MRKSSLIIYILLFTLLVSKAGYAERPLADAIPAAKAESAAWKKVTPLVMKKCTHDGQMDKISPDKAVAASNCLTKIINEQVLKVAIYPDLLKRYRADALDNAQAFANGEISRTEYEKHGAEIHDLYFAKVKSRLSANTGFSPE